MSNLFLFHRYLSPTWYFNLKPKGSIPYFPDWDKADSPVRSLIKFDDAFSTWEVSKLDAAWQAWHKGVILEILIRL